MVYQPHITDATEVLEEDEIMALIPSGFTFIAQVIGIHSVLSLIEAYGGTSIFVPTKMALNVQHPISRVIGLKNFKTLALHKGGQRIEIPMGTLIITHMRNRLIQKAIANGDSQAKAARKFSVTPRTVRTAIKAKIHPMYQALNLDLFEGMIHNDDEEWDGSE